MTSVLHISVTDAAKRGLVSLLREVAKHMFTAADGETYAVGRLLGVLLLVFGILAPSAVVVHMSWGKDLTMDEWVQFLNSMVLYIPALSGSTVGLITLTSTTEPRPPQEPKKEPIAIEEPA